MKGVSSIASAYLEWGAKCPEWAETSQQTDWAFFDVDAYLGVLRQGPSDSGTLLLASGERVRRSVCAVQQVHCLQSIPDQPGHCRLGEPVPRGERGVHCCYSDMQLQGLQSGLAS